jgi:hypothetical protein
VRLSFTRSSVTTFGRVFQVVIEVFPGVHPLSAHRSPDWTKLRRLPAVIWRATYLPSVDPKGLAVQQKLRQGVGFGNPVSSLIGRATNLTLSTFYLWLSGIATPTDSVVTV